MSHIKQILSILPPPLMETIAQGPVPQAPVAGRAPGLYVQVLDGLIHVTNPSGTSNFTPPPVFNQSTGPSSSTGPAKSNSVDCEVR